MTFSAKELGFHPEFTTLSLLQVTEGFVCIGIVGTSRMYSFLHSSIQELLAAWHISKMPHDLQLDLVHDRLGHQQFGEVFQFYAGITKLQTPGIRGILRGIVLDYKTLYCEFQLGQYYTPQPGSKWTIFIWLLNCLYEVHDMTLYYLVASELRDAPLDFTHTLNPTACLSLGYFLPWLCHIYSGVSKCTLWRIDDRGVELVMNGMRKALSDMQTGGQNTSGRLHLGFSSICDVLVYETKSISQMLQSSNCIIHTLDFSYYRLSVSPLKCLAESVSRNTSLQVLRVILRPRLEVSQAGPALCEMLEMNRTLQTLRLSGFNGIGGYIARGLMHNTALTSLSLEYCAVTDHDMESFARMLASNTSLKHLDLSGNRFSDTGICYLATALEYNTNIKGA